LDVLRRVLWTVLRFREIEAVPRFRGIGIFAGETGSGAFAILDVSLIAAPLAGIILVVGIILAAAAIVPKAIVAPNFG
jgi:hypothetical protein